MVQEEIRNFLREKKFKTKYAKTYEKQQKQCVAGNLQM